MNIFLLDRDPKKCAAYHCDKHSIKMVLEYSQILSTTHRVIDSGSLDDKILLKSTHVNHPVNIWVRESDSNYIWLSKLLLHLEREYSIRYSRRHLYHTNGLIEFLNNNIPKNLNKLEDPSFETFKCAIPESCVVSDDPVENYRNLYMTEKRHMISYRLNNYPKWFI